MSSTNVAEGKGAYGLARWGAAKPSLESQLFFLFLRSSLRIITILINHQTSPLQAFLEPGHRRFQIVWAEALAQRTHIVEHDLALL
jgi:hypothetical protein